MAGQRGWHPPRCSLTRIHSLDSNWRVTADGEAKAVLPPRDGDLGHSPARLLPEATRLLPLLQGWEAHRPCPRATLLSEGAGAKKKAGQPLLSLSWPRHLKLWVMGQAGRLGAQEVIQADAEGPRTDRAWEEQTSPSSDPTDTWSSPKSPLDLPTSTLPVTHGLLSPFLLSPRGSQSFAQGWPCAGGPGTKPT